MKIVEMFKITVFVKKFIKIDDYLNIYNKKIKILKYISILI